MTLNYQAIAFGLLAAGLLFSSFQSLVPAVAQDAGRGIVRFESVPSGAEVLLDGEVVCEVSDAGCNRILPLGNHEVEMKLAGYKRRVENRLLENGTILRWELEPDFGWLTVSSGDYRVGVRVDGESRGMTPLPRLVVGSGLHRVEIDDPRFLPDFLEVEVKKDREARLKLKPRPRTGELELRVLDSGLKPTGGTVSMGGRTLGKAPGKYNLPVGFNFLSVKGSGGTWSGPVRVAEGRTVKLEVRLGKPIGAGSMAMVPEGWFTMGCNLERDKECDADEFPGHRVWLDLFFIDVSEVTVDMFTDCVAAGVCKEPEGGDHCNWGVSGRGDHPMNCVSWYEARAYCRWVGKDLPSEAQWEKAARGDDGRIFPWGDQAPTCERASMWEGGAGCGTDGTLPVCSRPRGRSPYGCCDMSGNVMEWVLDPQDAEFYKSSPERNPLNPGYDSDKPRCLRGGERGYSITRFLRTSNRDGLRPDYGNYGIGFRCAVGSEL